MSKRSPFYELVLLGGGVALYWVFQNIFGNLFYGYVKQQVEKHVGVMEADLIAGFSLVCPSLLLAIGIVWGLQRYIRRELANERFDEKQTAADALSDEISWAISNLLNRSPPPDTDEQVRKWQDDFLAWQRKVSAMLSDRSFFTHSDQTHFDKIGIVTPKNFYPAPKISHGVSMLEIKIERMREIVARRQP